MKMLKVSSILGACIFSASIFSLAMPSAAMSSSATTPAFTPQRFVQRVGAIAEVADAAYCPERDLPVDGVDFAYQAQWSTNEVRVYKNARGRNENLIVSFCGTRLGRPETVGDLLLDFKGAHISSLAGNDWTRESYGDFGVGLGFQERVYNYMKSAQGRGLQDHYADRARPGLKTETTTTGHSLGGTTSQIFSFYLLRYLQRQESGSFPLYNFAFNAPKGFGPMFKAALVQEANAGSFHPYSFTVSRDPITAWGLSPQLRAAINQPNREGGAGEYQGYAHAELTPVTNRAGDLTNHGPGGILQRWGDMREWNPAVLAGMSQTYASSW